MFEFANNIKPLLVELDNDVPLDEPVRIDVLIALVKKHSRFKRIRLGPISRETVIGWHVAPRDSDMLTIYYRACSVHEVLKPERACPECRFARYILAKELSHAFDCANEQTTPEHVEEMLLKEIIKGESTANPQVQADVFGSLWSVELLMRYCQREQILGAGVLAESPRLTFARQNDDFAYFADQFCIPPGYAQFGFKANILSAMRTIRMRVELPVAKALKLPEIKAAE